jgi:succinylarginine dihydrolase
VAREVIELVKCDECGSEEDVEGFTIIREGTPRDVDLCGTHKAPLVKLYVLGVEGDPRPKPKRRPGRPSAHAVVPIEEWDGSSN